MTVPTQPKIYHIVHVDRLASIIADGFLWCDAVISQRVSIGTTIGMNHIKARRLNSPIKSRPGLNVGDCVPFYFCPRSVMLFLIWKGNPALTYKGGQGPIIHLQCDFLKSVAWADANNKRWAFTLSNAGAHPGSFEDRSDLTQLNQINWQAVQAKYWSGPGIDRSVMERKQAEFLMEYSFPWHLVELIGVQSQTTYQQVVNILAQSATSHRPPVSVKQAWYYR